MFSQKFTRSIAIGATAIAIGGGAYGLVSATASNGSGTATAATSPSATSGRPVSGGGGSNARSGPAAGGSSGMVDSVSTSSFAISTSAGQKVTINKASSTTYQKGTSSTLGECHYKRRKRPRTRDDQRNDHHGQPGHRATDCQRRICDVLGGRGGPLPARCTVHVEAGRSDPSELPSGVGDDRQRNEASKTTEAALAAYPGGIVDRVVKLSNGEYEIHNIGVNWPHHIFVDQNFKVIGAD